MQIAARDELSRTEATPAILFVITMRCILRFGKLWELNPVGAASCRDQ